MNDKVKKQIDRALCVLGFLSVAPVAFYLFSSLKEHKIVNML